MAHKIVFFTEGVFKHWARCRCGFTTKVMKHKDDVDDAVNKHREEVIRLRIKLKGQPTLKAEWAYYVKMAEDPNVSEADRVLWKRLADELYPRIKDAKDHTGDVELPIEVERSSGRAKNSVRSRRADKSSH